MALTEEERSIVEERTRGNAVVRTQKVDLYQYWEAIKEPRLYLLGIAFICNNLQYGGIITYANVLVRDLGFTPFQSILLQIPTGVLMIFYIVVAVAIQRKTKESLWTTVLCYIVSAVGCILLAVLLQIRTKLLGYYLTWSVSAASVMLVTIAGSTISGYSKKIIYNSINMILVRLVTLLVLLCWSKAQNRPMSLLCGVTSQQISLSLFAL